MHSYGLEFSLSLRVLQNFDRMKILVAQIISLAFLILFVSHHPYRRTHHHQQQVIAMLVPVVTMGPS